jgi:hypothetical protein
MTSLILFGAGASHGSGPVSPHPPPLGASLFAQLKSAFPASWGALPLQLDGRFEDDFEDGMGRLWQSGSHAVPLLMQHMAIYFAQFACPADGSNSYSQLVRALVENGDISSTVFASLNYECLLEIAVSQLGLSVAYFPSRDSAADAVPVLKLHGSCNFLPGPAVTATRGVSFGAGVTIEAGIQAINPSAVAPYCTGNTALYPAMSVYTAGKPVQISPAVINSILDTFHAEVKKARSICLVGIRPHPPDTHIWQPLAEAPGQLFFVGNEAAFHAWEANARRDLSSHFVAAAFRDCVPDLARIVHESLAA